MLSVVVPVYNGARVLPWSLPAVLALDSVDEWIWVNDGSTDATADVLAEWVNGHPRASVLPLPTNAGRAAARNAGWRAASGDTLVFLDADVRPHPQAAVRLADALQPPDSVASVGRLTSVVEAPADPYAAYLRYYARGVGAAPAGGRVSWKHFVTALCAVRREALDAASGFDERITYGEDLILACRLAPAWPEGLRAAAAEGEIRDTGTLDTALDKVALFGHDLRLAEAMCPSILDLAEVRALTHGPLAAAIRSRALGGLVRRTVGWLPAQGQAYAVRYLLGHTLALALHRARTD